MELRLLRRPLPTPALNASVAAAKEGRGEGGGAEVTVYEMRPSKKATPKKTTSAKKTTAPKGSAKKMAAATKTSARRKHKASKRSAS